MTATPMDRLTDRVTENEHELRVLQKENEIQARIFLKLEEVVEKNQTLTESMHRLLSIHDEKHKILNKDLEDIREEMTKDIKDLHVRITSETKILTDKIEKTETNILVQLAQFQKEWKEEKERRAVADVAAKEASSEKITGIVSKIDAWKWFIVGAVFVAGLVSGHTGILTALVHLVV
jgi:hypothetical protein